MELELEPITLPGIEDKRPSSLPALVAQRQKNK